MTATPGPPPMPAERDGLGRVYPAVDLLRRFVAWLDRADEIADDAAYLNGEHPEQRAACRNGWDDVRDIASEARLLLGEMPA